VDQVTLLREDFGAFPTGPFPCDYSPLGEYHVPPLTGFRGRWREASVHHAWRGPNWQVVPFAEGPAMAMTRRRRQAVALLVAGDELWSDYEVAADVRPLAREGRAGLAGRLLHARRYVAAWIEGAAALVLAERDHDRETVLARAEWPCDPDRFHRLSLSFAGRRVVARVEGGPTVEGETGLARGRVGLAADAPAAFREVAVTAPRPAVVTWEGDRRVEEVERATAQARQPRPLLWRTLDVAGFGAGKSVRWGDLDGDGRLECVLAQHVTLAEGDAALITCLTAIDLDGRVLWRWGRPNPHPGLPTQDVPFQVHDLDGDGRPEVVAATHFRLTVRDGLTGRVRAEADMPPPGPRQTWCDERLFARVPGDAVAFADLRGVGRPTDVLVKDRYNNLWAYDDRLRPLWHWSGETGHFPCPYDVDGDGRDEVLVGGTLLGPDGAVRWSVRLGDHADAVLLGPYGLDGRLVAVLAAGDAGIRWVDPRDGSVWAEDATGHVQGVTAARLRPDLPGLQFVTTTFWGEPGVVTLYNALGQRMWQAQPNHLASHLEPVNWRGDGTELLLLSADPEEGGLLDGWGRRVVALPRDGHPTLAATALDLTGDPRDEIVAWDTERLWIYTPDDRPAPGGPDGRVYAPRRLPLWNASNYRAQASLPGWA
jgi:rhamnogalacturonan endolyase